MSGLVAVLKEDESATVRIVKYSFDNATNTLLLKSERKDNAIILWGDLFFTKQSDEQYHLISISNYTTYNDFTPLLAQLVEENASFPNGIDFLLEKPSIELYHESEGEILSRLELAYDLDSEACKPIPPKRLHGSSASPYGLFDDRPQKRQKQNITEEPAPMVVTNGLS
jgi:hypothetical protein